MNTCNGMMKRIAKLGLFPKNRFPIPSGWSEDPESYRSLPSGFEAVTFTNGTEIVISFAGTGGDGDWWHGNIPLAGGQLSDQLRQAAAYYTLAAREANVVDIHVLGEILSVQPLFSRIGAQIEVTQQNSNMLFPQIELHSQALLTAFLQSDYASPQNQKLNEVTFKLSDLLQMILDEKLYKKDPKSTEENFLERLVKHEAGVQGSITADAMVTRFTSDLWKLAQDGGMTLKDGNDTIFDSSDNTQSNLNILRFGAGVSKDNIRLRLGSLMLDLGNGDAVHIEGFDQNDVFNSSSINSFKFADGSSLSTTELLSRGG